MMFYLATPILLVQGRRVRARTPRLPEAGGPVTGCVAGDGAPLRIAVVGESTAAGVGAERHAEALPGFLAAEVAARTGRAVAWSVHARTGLTAAQVGRDLLGGLARGPRPQVVVVAVGVNDLLGARTLGRFEHDVTALLRGVRAAGADVPIVLSGMPPLHRFPSLPQPMRAILGRRARAMDARLRRSAAGLPGVRHRTFELPADLAAFFASDGFHPGTEGYRRWAAELAPHVADAARNTARAGAV